MNNNKWFIFLLVFLVAIAGATAVSVGNCSDLRAQLNANADIELASDIDCGDYTWVLPAAGYSHILNGNNHTISNLFYNGSTSNNEVSLIPSPGNGAIIKKFCMINETMIGNIWVSGIDGQTGSTAIIDQVCILNSYFKCYRAVGCYACGIVGDDSAAYEGDVSNSYVANSRMVSLSGSSANGFGAGGVFCYGGYRGDINNSFSYNNTIISDIGTPGAFGTTEYSYEGYIYNNFASNNYVGNTTHSYNITNYRYGFIPNGNSQGINNWYGNSTRYNDSYATGRQSDSFNNSANAPLSSWDFVNVWKSSSYGYPIFQWQSDIPPDSPPQWSLNTTNATTPMYLGTVVNSRVQWSDDTALGYYIFSTDREGNGIWINGSAIGFGAGNGNYSTDYTLTKSPGNKTISYKWFVNDSSNQWNTTPVWTWTVTDKYPVPGLNVLNKTGTIYIGTPISFYNFFRDDSNLSFSNMTLWNTTHMLYTNTNQILGWASYCYTYNNYCMNPSTPAWGYVINQTGILRYNVCMNDTNNQWACSPLTNFTVPEVNPQYYDYGSDVSSIPLGGLAYLYSNWTTSSGTLTQYKLNEKLPNGTWYNTSWMAFSCASYTDCIANVTSIGTMEPIGMHYFTFTAENSVYGTNETPMYGINVTVSHYIPPQWTNFTQSDWNVSRGTLINFTAQWVSNPGFNLNYWWFENNGTLTVSDKYLFTDSQSSYVLNTSGEPVGTYIWSLTANSTPCIEPNNAYCRNWTTDGLGNLKTYLIYNLAPIIPSDEWYVRLWNVGPAWSLFNLTYYPGNLFEIVQNFTDEEALGIGYMNDTFPNGTVIQTIIDCSGSPSCDTHGYPYYNASDIGIHYFQFAMNDSENAWSYSPIRNYTVISPGAGANISHWSINPCLTIGGSLVAWQVGGLPEVSITGVTYDGSKVSARTIWYADNTTYYNETAWDSYYPSGHIFNIIFTNLSYVIDNSSLQLQVRDDGANTTITTFEFRIAVSNSGLMVDECISDSTVLVPPTGGQSLWIFAFLPLANGLGVSLEIGWIIIMLCIVGVIWWKFHSEPMIAGIGSFCVCFAWMFLGMVLHIVGVAVFSMLVLLLLIAAGITIWMMVKRR